MGALSVEEIENLKGRVRNLEKTVEVLIIYSEMTRKNNADNGYLCNKIHRDIEYARLLLKQTQ